MKAIKFYKKADDIFSVLRLETEWLIVGVGIIVMTLAVALIPFFAKVERPEELFLEDWLNLLEGCMSLALSFMIALHQKRLSEQQKRLAEIQTELMDLQTKLMSFEQEALLEVYLVEKKRSECSSDYDFFFFIRNESVSVPVQLLGTLCEVAGQWRQLHKLHTKGIFLEPREKGQKLFLDVTPAEKRFINRILVIGRTKRLLVLAIFKVNWDRKVVIPLSRMYVSREDLHRALTELQEKFGIPEEITPEIESFCQGFLEKS